MKLIPVDKTNFEAAIAIQREIFAPEDEDGTLNFLSSIDPEIYAKIYGSEPIEDFVQYFLAQVNEDFVGVSGLYTEEADPESIWLAWFGILPKFRGQGLGEELLLKTIELAQSEKYSRFKNFRLYTDFDMNHNAVNLYEKLGFTGEKYTAEDLDYDCRIYSKSLIGEKVTPWNNRNLNLTAQVALEHLDRDEIQKILNDFKNNL